jgi:D-glycero-alpha-D-manno-heptose 1-phosphate guanylyltransferase
MLMNKNSNLQLPLFVLAGGLGTRLQPVLGGLPKALALVDGKPFLYFQIKNWIDQGCSSFIFLLHHHANLVVDFLKAEENNLLKDCQVQYIIEPTLLGTGGAIAYAVEQLKFDGDFLLTNADTWLSAGLRQMILERSPSILEV